MQKDECDASKLDANADVPLERLQIIELMIDYKTYWPAVHKLSLCWWLGYDLAITLDIIS